jgi:hypothetical protein
MAVREPQHLTGLFMLLVVVAGHIELTLAPLQAVRVVVSLAAKALRFTDPPRTPCRDQPHIQIQVAVAVERSARSAQQPRLLLADLGLTVLLKFVMQTLMMMPWLPQGHQPTKTLVGSRPILGQSLVP